VRAFHRTNKEKIMKVIFATSIFVIAALASASPASANEARTHGAHRQKFVRYSPIGVKVKANLVGERAGDLLHIKVDTTNNGRVFLSGEVKSQKDADKAVSIARLTPGVISVTSTIQIIKEVARMIV
jgi:osmotically-inducible protein OsmY